MKWQSLKLTLLIFFFTNAQPLPRATFGHGKIYPESLMKEGGNNFGPLCGLEKLAGRS